MRALRITLALVTAATLAAACSGGGGGGGGGSIDPGTPGGTLTSGTYEISDYDLLSDGCYLYPSSPVGNTSEVFVAGTSLTIGTTTGAIFGSNFTTSFMSELDFSDDPFGFGALDCLTERYIGREGLCHGDDRALVHENISVTPVSGTECDEAADRVSDLAGRNIEFPCTTEADLLIEKQQ